MKSIAVASLVVGAAACAPRPADLIAQPIVCPEGSSLLEQKIGNDGLERKCVRAGQNHGPLVSTRASGSFSSVTYQTWEEGQLRAEQEYWLVAGRWAKRTDIAFAPNDVVLRLHNVFGAVTVDGEMPDGTGTFEIRGNGRRALGACRAGLRDGAWIEEDAGGAAMRVRTYRDGVLDGPFKDGAERGEVRGGRRDGSWTFVRQLPGCALMGTPGSQCGFRECQVHYSAMLTARYDDACLPTLTSVDWGITPENERIPEATLDLPSCTLPAHGAETCAAIARWASTERVP